MALFLGPQHIERLFAEGHVAMADVVGAVESSFREQGEHQLGILPRQVLAADGASTSTRVKSLKLSASYLRDSGLVGASIYTAHFRPGGLEMWFTLFSGETGEMLAVLNGTSLSLWKTGATAAVAAKHLARSDASRVALIGTGRYAVYQLLGLAAVRRIDRVDCYSRRPEAVQRFITRMQPLLPSVALHAAHSARAAVADADIAVTITTSAEPVLEGAWLRPGQHLNVMGAHDPQAREIDSTAVQRSRLVVDSIDQALNEKGELLMPLAEKAIVRAHLLGELGDVVTGNLQARRSDGDITAFLSGGTALEYVHFCALLRERALAAGIGQPLEI